MGELIPQLTETYEDNLIFPDTLKRTIANYRAARYAYKVSDDDKDRERAYIEYNTLREQRLETEEITINKIQRLFDRDTEQEHIVYFQKSRVKDFNNNYVPCPIVEKIGVVPKPISNISNDERNKVKNVSIIETQNDYYIPFTKEKIIELFESSKDRHKIVCYVGYSRPTRAHKDDTIEGKRIIWNQDKFVNADFNELTDTDEDIIKVLEKKKQYIIPNRIRTLNKPKQKGTSQRVDTLAELLPSKSKVKHVEEVAEVLEDQQVNDQLSGTSNSIVNDTQKEFDELMNKDE